MPGIESIECSEYKTRNQKVGNKEWTEIMVDGIWIKDGTHKETKILSRSCEFGAVYYEIEITTFVYNKGSVISYDSYTTEEVVRYD